MCYLMCGISLCIRYLPVSKHLNIFFPDYNATLSAYTSPVSVAKPRIITRKPSSLLLQEMANERSVSRARKQRTCFTEKQVGKLYIRLALKVSTLYEYQ